MVRHIVMWKLKDSAQGRTKKENAKIIKERLESLKNVIPEIISIEVGINVSLDGAAYDAVLISDFKSIEDVKIYQNNPNHVEISKFIGQIREERVTVDYEL